VTRHAALGATVMWTLAVLAAGAGLAPRAANAQAVPQRAALVSVSVVPETVTVGEPFTVRIRVRAPKFATIRFPAVPDTADAIEAVDPRATQDAGDADVIDRTAIYRLVAWDVGQRTPRFANVVVGEGGKSQEYPVALQPVIVRSLLPADSLERIPRDVRDPVAPPGALWKVLLLSALLLAALAWFWRRRRARRAAAPPPEVDPFVAAKLSFEALDALGLAAAGEPGRHVIASVDLLRGYLARRFPEMRESLTAEELERAVAASDLPVLPERLNVLLRREASLRFARAGIETAEAVALAKESEAIVRDIQTAYDARIRAMERRPRRGRRQ
jgi:hypothetical protein